MIYSFVHAFCSVGYWIFMVFSMDQLGLQLAWPSYPLLEKNSVDFATLKWRVHCRSSLDHSALLGFDKNCLITSLGTQLPHKGSISLKTWHSSSYSSPHWFPVMLLFRQLSRQGNYFEILGISACTYQELLKVSIAIEKPDKVSKACFHCLLSHQQV